MIRIIVRRDQAHMAANVGGAVLTSFTTIDVEIPELETMLRSAGWNDDALEHAQVVGVEVLP